MIEYISEIFEDWEVLAHRDNGLKDEIENLKKENREIIRLNLSHPDLAILNNGSVISGFIKRVTLLIFFKK